MAWPIGHAWFVEGHDGSVRLHPMPLWHVRDPDQAGAFRAVTDAADLAPGEGLPGRVYLSRAATWVSDVGVDPAFPRRKAASASGLRTACAFPILIGREPVAVVEFYVDRVVERDDALLQLLPQVATHLGRVIERRRSEERLIHDASHDPLTGLPNRALFLDRLEQAIARRTRRADTQFGVLFIDLDRFKIVNDSLGHLAGDSLIVQVARRLETALGDHDLAARAGAGVPGSTTLARLGGDEFTILVTDIAGPSDAVRLAHRMEDALRLPFLVDGQEVYTSASIGVASSASGYASAGAILRDADLAMYRAKELGKARAELFDREMHQAAMQRLALETDLRRALQNGEFVLHYQPIVALESNAIAGFEALVRWQKPAAELVYPGDFIDVLEDTGLIVALGRWVLREACRTVRVLQERSPRLSISVNVSPRQFREPDLVAEIRAVIAEAAIDPGCLRLEITEGVTIGDADRVAKILGELQGIGVRVSLDDFGTGYSSLKYLRSLPLDVLKIDRSFVAAMEASPESLQVVKTIIDLAGNLGMDVVAEGAEQAGQVAQLRAMGCGFCQGYYFSKPVDLAGAARLITP